MPGPDDSEDSSMQSVPLMFPPSGIVMTLSDDNVYCPSPRLAPPQLSVGQTTWGISEEISSHRPHIIFPILSIHHGCPQSHNLPTHVIAGNCLVKASQCPAASIAAHGAALWRQQTWYSRSVTILINIGWSDDSPTRLLSNCPKENIEKNDTEYPTINFITQES